MKISSILRTLLFVLSLLTAYCLPPASVPAAEKWPGVDESVVEKYAKEQGRAAHEPLINTGQGDLLLFVFLIAGTVGGFVAGYYWRMLVVEKLPTTTREKK
jgi:ABC-type cobalt transport system substrate-binding protein